jgi:hypothetical protein
MHLTSGVGNGAGATGQVPRPAAPFCPVYGAGRGGAVTLTAPFLDQSAPFLLFGRIYRIFCFFLHEKWF